MRSDFEVTVRVRNNQLKSRRDELGFSQRQMADAIGLGVGSYAELESMRRSPLSPKGHWRPAALALASFFDAMPDDLFPPDVLGIENNVATRTANASEIMAITNGSDTLALPASETFDSAELSERMDQVLSLLTEREQLVVHMHFYEDMTYEQIGQELFISNERVRSVLNKALRRMRHPRLSKGLDVFAGGVGYYYYGGDGERRDDWDFEELANQQALECQKSRTHELDLLKRLKEKRSQKVSH